MSTAIIKLFDMMRGDCFLSTIYKNLATQEVLYMVKGGWGVGGGYTMYSLRICTFVSVSVFICQERIDLSNKKCRSCFC